jgi:DNA-binding transcriptional MerR regulator
MNYDEAKQDLEFINQFVLKEYGFCLKTIPQYFHIESALETAKKEHELLNNHKIKPKEVIEEIQDYFNMECKYNSKEKSFNFGHYCYIKPELHRGKILIQSSENLPPHLFELVGSFYKERYHE